MVYGRDISDNQRDKSGRTEGARGGENWLQEGMLKCGERWKKVTDEKDTELFTWKTSVTPVGIVSVQRADGRLSWESI